MIREVDWVEAEAFVGKRLDRRRSYGIGPGWDERGDVLMEVARYTHSCSGCFEGGEYGGLEHYYEYDKKARCRIGSGCSECGYTGKRREEIWVPHSSAEIMRSDDF